MNSKKRLVQTVQQEEQDLLGGGVDVNDETWALQWNKDREYQHSQKETPVSETEKKLERSNLKVNIYSDILFLISKELLLMNLSRTTRTMNEVYNHKVPKRR
jgi:hypothetical protein